MCKALVGQRDQRALEVLLQEAVVHDPDIDAVDRLTAQPGVSKRVE
jgi:hypothetical protein